MKTPTLHQPKPCGPTTARFFLLSPFKKDRKSIGPRPSPHASPAPKKKLDGRVEESNIEAGR